MPVRSNWQAISLCPTLHTLCVTVPQGRVVPMRSLLCTLTCTYACMRVLHLLGVRVVCYRALQRRVVPIGGQGVDLVALEGCLPRVISN